MTDDPDFRFSADPNFSFEGAEPAASHETPPPEPPDQLEVDLDHEEQILAGQVGEGARIEIVRDSGLYYWAFFAANGQPVAVAMKGLRQLSHLKATLNAMRAAFATAPIIKNY